MGMSSRACQNALLRLQEVCNFQPPTEPSRETSQCQDDRPGATFYPKGDAVQLASAAAAQKDTEVSRNAPPTNNNTEDSVAEKTKQDVNRRGRGRLTELEQQLEMAESRCGTLKQQLDYMRILYQGVDRTRTLSDVTGFEVPEEEEPVKVKVKKEKRHHHHKRRPGTEGVFGSQSVGGKQGDKPGQRRKQYDTASLSAVPTSSRNASSQREITVTDLTKLARPEDQPIRDLIDFTDRTPPAEVVADGGGGGQEAAQVIQDILCGITHTVNRAAGHDDEQQQPVVVASKGSRKRHRRCREASSHTLVDLDDEDDNVATRESVSMVEMRPIVSEPTVDDIYGDSFQRVYANDNLTRKSTKTGHSPRRDQPYGLASVGPDAESDDSLRTAKRKKATGKKASDKKPRPNGPYTHHHAGTAGAGKANDDASTATAKPRKKKLMKTRNATSRCTLKSHRHKNVTTADAAENIPAYSSEQTPYDSWQNNNNNLVEIYHNAAIRTETSISEEHIKGVLNDSDTPSMMSYLKKTREEPNIPGRLGVGRPETGSVLCVDEAWERRSNSAGGRLNRARSEMATDSVARFNRESSKISHFELPTVSSRMKQVDRSYLQRFNFRTIPFVVGKSTTPTHNLGLNIQQVLSMIKMRQPVSGLSPMALAGGLLRESQMPGNGQGPITSYLERMSSRPTTTRRGVALPPTIPEHEEMELPRHDDDDDEGCRDFEVHQGAYRGSRPATAADLGLRRETNNHDEFETYRADWGKRRSEPTTFPNKKYNNYHQVLSQYLDGEQLSFLQGPPTPRTRGAKKRFGSRPRRGEGEEFNKTLHHQMNGMKEVMQRLHDDFNQLSQDYDELCATVERDDAGMLIHDEDHETLREMAAAVQNKENEIKLVMELLDEVSTLHKMVASLNQKTSMASMTGRLHAAPRQKQSRIVPREPTTSIRLTRLLRTIQSFQEKLKQEK